MCLFAGAFGLEGLFTGKDDAEHLDGHPEHAGDTQGGGGAEEDDELGFGRVHVVFDETKHEEEEDRAQHEVHRDGDGRDVLLLGGSVDVVVGGRGRGHNPRTPEGRPRLVERVFRSVGRTKGSGVFRGGESASRRVTRRACIRSPRHFVATVPVAAVGSALGEHRAETSRRVHKPLSKSRFCSNFSFVTRSGASSVASR